MKLIITEKPSVAQSIAMVLGASQRGEGYLEGNGYCVSWCVGHLVELAAPDAYDSKYVKWSKADLPILPDPWQYRVSAATQKQFDILKALMKREDVTSLICATDAGREGELIFRLVYHQCKCKKPFERLWISSMEDSAIREGFAHLKPSTEYDALYEAALCRERADWIVGINATRLFSCLYGQPLNVGRVMTPTLAIAVEREAQIAAFVPEPFYTVQLSFEGGNAESRRFKNRQEAESLLTGCRTAQSAMVQSVERREKAEKAPALYDLTSLQRDANRLLGFTAQQTLDYTQNLYEKKLVTYPRTDSRYLTEDMKAAVPSLTEAAKAVLHTEQSFAVHPEQVVNSKKVTDHHAILPTKNCKNCNFEQLPQGELQILQLLSVRLLAAVGDPCRTAETVILLECGGETFTVKGKTVLQEGWKAVEKKYLTAGKAEKEEVTLPDLREGSGIALTDVKLKEGKTSPPKHFTEDTLLSAMERAGADETDDDVERKGIGTPATRAGIIEKLVQKGFLERVGEKKTKVLLPTEKGAALITVMPEQLQSQRMTAEWENKLLLVERGEMSRHEFMTEIQQMITALVETSEVVKGASTLMPKNKIVGTCPHCGAEVTERQKGWFCANRECRFVLWKDNAFFKALNKHLTGQMVDKLLRDGRVKLKDCRSAKTGKSFNAAALLTTEADGRAKFALEFEKGGKA